MKHLILLLITVSSVTYGQSPVRIPVYSNEKGIVIDGFDKEPPFIDYYKSALPNPSGQAILICPGGGYAFLAVEHEGSDVAKFFNQRGFDAFVLHYRINNAKQEGHRFPDEYNDVTTAMRLIKSRALEWKLNPEKIGVIGFSAGGHLASMLGTMHVKANPQSPKGYEKFNSRPAFMILGYPVISLNANAHRGSAEMLLGKNAPVRRLDSLSTFNRVTAETPPTFMVYSDDDKVVLPENGILFYQALRKAGVKASLHIYEYGGHGFGLAPKDPGLNSWGTLAVEWLKRLGYEIK